MDYGPTTERKLSEIAETCERAGRNSIVALAGVPGTGKSMMALIAAQRFASQPEMVRAIQFHPSYSYEEFIEGMRIADNGSVKPERGILLDWNQKALDDEDNRYVLLIDELTRANVSAVLGELMTYVEYRDRTFTTVYSRRPVNIAENLLILATYNPTDRSAVEVDAALIRRLRIIQCPPSEGQLRDMLAEKVNREIVTALQGLFGAARDRFPDEFDTFMPFGHGIFSGVSTEFPDLHRLWIERLQYFLRRPLAEPHKFADVIEQNYPWRDPAFRLSSTVTPPTAT
jgi:5-methylcytosine-specific restriction endonuclease McrBC GTP-binding regulatory subunit McrB